MTVTLIHLNDPGVRGLMLDELASDIANGREYEGTQLSISGSHVWFELFREAIADHDPDWLSQAIATPNYWLATYVQNRATGPVQAKVPSDAPTKLANGEFIHYYIRAVCLSAVSRGAVNVRVVRVRESTNPRPESLALEGSLLNAEAVLDDVRENHNSYRVLGVPPGPNSGLAVAMA